MPTNSKKNTLIIVAILIVLVIAALAWWQQQGPKETIPTSSVGGSTSTLPAVSPAGDQPQAINDSLQNIDTGNLEKEFQAIDKDMNAL